jgi:large subunit ribosomal protein L19
MNTIQKISQEQAKQDRHPDFVIGDTVKVHYKIKEGGKERIQVYSGTVIARKGGGVMESITVRRISYGEGVERVFPLNSPSIDKIEIERHGKVRRAKLYYLRDLAGKKARIKERRV